MAKPVVGWFEVTGRDGAALQRFYSDVFGWEVSDAGDGSGYGLVDAAAPGIGGGIGASQDGGAGHVTFYVEVDDPALYLNRVEEHGGQVIAPPADIPEYNLTFAFFADPEGHVVGLSKGAIRG